MKRFYKTVSTAALEGGQGVSLDGRPVRTPAKTLLVLPTLALAEAVAEEWRAQAEEIQPHSMPLTQLCCTALDLVLPQAEAVMEEVAAYGASDLLCYRAEAPEGLVERQERLWQPLLDWAAERYGARLSVTRGLMAIAQPPQALAALSRAVADHRGLALVALAQFVRASGSLVIGLALTDGRLTVEEAFAAAEIDSLWQMQLWGEDAEALARHARLRADLEAAAQLLSLTRVN